MLDLARGRSCLVLAVEAQGKSIQTVEGMADSGKLHPLQQAFIEHGGFQCGFCTPGMLITARDIILRLPELTEADDERIRNELAGNLCRCTGYQGIVKAIQSVIRQRAKRDNK